MTQLLVPWNDTYVVCTAPLPNLPRFALVCLFWPTVVNGMQEGVAEKQAQVAAAEQAVQAAQALLQEQQQKRDAEQQVLEDLNGQVQEMHAAMASSSERTKKLQVGRASTIHLFIAPWHISAIWHVKEDCCAADPGLGLLPGLPLSLFKRPCTWFCCN